MSSRRQNQVAGFIRDEVSDILLHEMKDPRLGFASITEVEMSPDLRYARLYVSVFGPEEEKTATIEALSGASGYIRRLLAPRIHIRHIPELTFQIDRSMEHAEEINRTLNEIKEERSSDPDVNSQSEE